MARSGGRERVRPRQHAGALRRVPGGRQGVHLREAAGGRGGETRACRNRTRVPRRAPPVTEVLVPVNASTRCAILLHAPNAVQVGEAPISRGGGIGVRYVGTGCIVVNRNVTTRNACADLGFVLPPVDPVRAPALDPLLAARLAAITPDRVLWDIDGDGRTDVSCPGTAPGPADDAQPRPWRPRAVLVARDSDESGVFGARSRASTTLAAAPTARAASARPSRSCAAPRSTPPQSEVGPASPRAPSDASA